jgi:hypothetical protein
MTFTYLNSHLALYYPARVACRVQYKKAPTLLLKYD